MQNSCLVIKLLSQAIRRSEEARPIKQRRKDTKIPMAGCKIAFLELFFSLHHRYLRTRIEWPPLTLKRHFRCCALFAEGTFNMKSCQSGFLFLDYSGWGQFMAGRGKKVPFGEECPFSPLEVGVIEASVCL